MRKRSRATRYIRASLFASLMALPMVVKSTHGAKNFETHCKHCHNAAAEKLLTKRVISVDGILLGRESHIALTELLQSHYLLLQPEQLEALVEELNELATELDLDLSAPQD